ncbi:MAG: TrbC/VirB2 family protein [Dehalococcoidia bacterium]
MKCRLLAITLVAFLAPSMLLAAGSGMPWEGPLDQILNSLTGPWLRFGSVVAIMAVGFMLAFGETGGILKRALQAVLGLSVACAATGWGLSFFGFNGGLGF